MAEEKKLNNRQLLAIPHILSASTITEASKKAKVTTPTLYNWLKDETFKAELKRQRSEIVNTALNKLQASITGAVEELVKLTKAEREEVRRLACNDIISHALKSIEIEDMEQRLDKVERLILERKTYRR